MPSSSRLQRPQAVLTPGPSATQSHTQWLESPFTVVLCGPGPTGASTRHARPLVQQNGPVPPLPRALERPKPRWCDTLALRSTARCPWALSLTTRHRCCDTLATVPPTLVLESHSPEQRPRITRHRPPGRPAREARAQPPFSA